MLPENNDETTKTSETDSQLQGQQSQRTMGSQRRPSQAVRREEHSAVLITSVLWEWAQMLSDLLVVQES